MSPVVNRRVLLETVNSLVRASAPTAEQLQAVFQALAQVTTDLTGDHCKLVLQFSEECSATAKLAMKKEEEEEKV